MNSYVARAVCDERIKTAIFGYYGKRQAKKDLETGRIGENRPGMGTLLGIGPITYTVSRRSYDKAIRDASKVKKE